MSAYLAFVGRQVEEDQIVSGCDGQTFGVASLNQSSNIIKLLLVIANLNQSSNIIRSFGVSSPNQSS